MLINSINNVSFGRALKPEEIRRFSAVCNEGKKLAGQTGQSIFIVHDACLPQSKESNTGVGNISSKDSQEFFTYMKQYLGFNRVEVLPGGELKPNNGLYCPYSSSCLSLGNHQINLELLTQDKFGKILLPEEYKQVIDANTAPNKETIVNYNNVMIDGSAQEEALKKAFARFKNLDEQAQLKKDFRKFISENDDWLEPKAIYRILSQKYGIDDYNFWNEIDKQLYENSTNLENRSARIREILKESPDDAEYYKFKQFLADKHLTIGRKQLNNIGVQLIGDCEINFSKDEIWANPNAFKQDEFIGEREWKVLSLDYDKIKDRDSASAKLLKCKVELHARRYDAIRFDVGWSYVVPEKYGSLKNIQPKELGDDVLNLIEETVKEVKGKDYDLNNLIYEFQGGKIFKKEYQNGVFVQTGKLIEAVEKRVGVYDTSYMHENLFDPWGSNDGFLKRGWSPDKFVVGVSNHDTQPLRQIANNIYDSAAIGNDKYHKEPAIAPLAKILKLDESSLYDPVEFAKAKWAEPMMAKNNMMFYMDVFGREERFNMHQLNTTVHPEKNFAYKIPVNYKEAYHKAVQEGYGFNIMDSLEKVFKAKGLDKTQPKLYKEIVKFRDILYENDGVKLAKKTMQTNKYPKLVLLAAAAIITAGTAITVFFTKKNKNNPLKSNIHTSDSNTYSQTLTASNNGEKNTGIKSNIASIGISFNDFMNKSSK